MKTTRATLTLVDQVAADALQISRAARDGALGTQAALVRALADELARHHPADRRVVPLHAQLGEEIVRLGALIAGDGRRAAPANPVPPDVLVVEDDPAALGAIASAVNGLGYPVRCAADAEAAIRESEENPAPIVVSDWNMPGASGLDLCQILKERDPHTYFILLTAFPDDSIRLDGVRQGVDDFLLKPIDIDELAGRLRAAEMLLGAVEFLGMVGERIRARATARPRDEPPADDWTA